MASWEQVRFTLTPRSKGTYLITDEVLGKLPQIKSYEVGILHLFLQHTSAAISLNENCDPDVRVDMNHALDRVAPEGNYYIHADEGPDDMPGHVKSTVVGVSLSIPISNGRLATGTWQGIYLLEFRAYRHARRIVATINGQKKTSTPS
ncbi:conserved hypothetical protein [Scheffersomyces stipitis CBS 6054]|uniref:Secondary thiamine-phosphate synthase enzyme n=1 Tax=Scheffersomyces stipitis (strain ATCC 58785 / CBS 6054 / NBRC 10063 / NRRL Y-11545) TaxID=322104 RepID=A3LXJ4_PICST|nr:conserved hypothetical protein [Scheffersomyces stipitis CBS 6054]ABN67469.1 conserved hypothetical protein [Scheffersomyces stipitis CBS 6054]KAG2732459.1 hypothetical protein G9P44_004876 [Scheffersomyces stipitis]